MKLIDGSLLHVLVKQYDVLLDRLARRLGSRGLAEEALHDTYVKISRLAPAKPVSNPTAYLVRAALNAAADRRVLSHRRGTTTDEAALNAAVEERPGPEDIVASRHEWTLLKAALNSLPSRRRQIFLAAWVEEVPYSRLAELHGVTIRTIQSEVKKALHHCAEALGR